MILRKDVQGQKTWTAKSQANENVLISELNLDSKGLNEDDIGRDGGEG